MSSTRAETEYDVYVTLCPRYACHMSQHTIQMIQQCLMWVWISYCDIICDILCILVYMKLTEVSRTVPHQADVNVSYSPSSHGLQIADTENRKRDTAAGRESGGGLIYRHWRTDAGLRAELTTEQSRRSEMSKELQPQTLNQPAAGPVTVCSIYHILVTSAELVLSEETLHTGPLYTSYLIQQSAPS